MFRYSTPILTLNALVQMTWFTNKTFLADGLPSVDKLQALLSLAAPPPEGAEEGIFGPDIFAGEQSDFISSPVQSFNIFKVTNSHVAIVS